MGKQWKKAGKMAEAARKGAVFTKLAREIQVAAKLGGSDPEMNSRLKMAIGAAQKASCPKDTIERAIKKGAGLEAADTIEELTYEGYGPHGVGVIVECQSDNKTRTVSEIRNLFKKNGGSMGESGSVQWMFDRVALIEGHKDNVEDPEADAIEAGAMEVEKTDEDNIFQFYGDPEDLDHIRTQLGDRGWDVTVAELSYKPKETTPLTDEQKDDVYTLLNALEDNEDSHRVHASI